MYYPFFPCVLTTHCSTMFEHLTVHCTSRGTCQLQRECVDMPLHNACVVCGTYRPCMLAMQHSQCSSVSPYVRHCILHGMRWTQHKHVITPLCIARAWHVTPIVMFKRMSACIQSHDVWNTLAIAQTHERTIACRTCDAWCTLPLRIDTYHPYQTYPHISEHISMYLNIS